MATELDESIGIRQLSHDTTKVLKDLESNPRLVAVTKHGRIVALLIPTSVPSLVKRWLDLNPRRAHLLRSIVAETLPGSESTGEDEFRRTDDEQPVAAVGVKEFAQATSEYLRRAEDGEWIFLRRHGRPIALLVRFSLPELVRLSIQDLGT